MEWIWIAPLALFLIWLAVGFGFFCYSFARGKELQIVRKAEDPKSKYHPFLETLRNGQDWFRAHPGEMVSITSEDGLTLRARYIPGDPKKCIVLMHGYRSRPTNDFCAVASIYHEKMGMSLLLPYQRAHGESDGLVLTLGDRERKDVNLWVNYAAKRVGESGILFLSGVSMGAASVLMSLGYEQPKQLRGVIADCGFTSPAEIIAHVIRTGFHMRKFPFYYSMLLFVKIAGFSLNRADARKVLAENHIPILFIHGVEDSFVPCWMTRENYAADAGEKEAVYVEKAEHATSYLLEPDRVERKVTEFIQKHIVD
jgi:fermentation-respiration switch protein FrsA (DUF1100 family)